jgi:hypothetical protein
VLFIVYVTGSEINDLLGDGDLFKVFKVFFTRRSSELKSTRRARIRQLVRLARLTEAHSIETLSDQRSGPHADLVKILSGLAARKPGHSVEHPPRPAPDDLEHEPETRRKLRNETSANHSACGPAR